MTRNIQRIESAFDKHLLVLKAAQATVLDVKTSEWTEHYNRFKLAVRDMEVMLQNTIASAFDFVSTVDSGVELLDYFSDVRAL